MKHFTFSLFLALLLGAFSAKAQSYCAFSSSSTIHYISDFSTQNATQNIDNSSSGMSTDGYGDFSAMEVETYPGGSFDFIANFNNGQNGDIDYNVKIWVDWNNDFQFDISEVVYSSGDGWFLDATGTITVPAGITSGSYRMRVVIDHVEWQTVNMNPCASTTAGEAEDYTITVNDNVTCPPPSALLSSNVTTTTSDLAWTEAWTETEWIVTYGVMGFDPTTAGTTFNVNDGPDTTLTGLLADTKYDVYVQAVCGSNDESVKYGPHTFRTACSSVGIPYAMDFENATIPNVEYCTSIENAGTGNEWVTASPGSNGFLTQSLTYTSDSYYPANVWFYTQGVDLQAGVNYKVKYTYGNDDATKTGKMDVAFGTSPSAADMTNSLVSYTNITGATAMNDSIEFTVPADGVYFFGFNALSDEDQGQLFLDDINIDLGPTCFAVSDLMVTDIQNEQATVTWTNDVSAVNGYEINIFLNNEDPLTATPIVTETVAAGVTTVTITGLVGKTAYDVYVTSNCDSGETEMTVPVSFTTDNLSVSDNELMQVSYAPNPVRSVLNVTAESKIESVVVYSLTGKSVLEVNGNNTSLSIDMSSLSNGTYFVKAKVAGSLSTFKIVKQ